MSPEIASCTELLLPKEFLQTFFSAPTDVLVGRQNGRRFPIFQCVNVLLFIRD